MPKIAEAYCQGTNLNLRLLEAAKTQLCLIKGSRCDGGGNRYASNINLKNSPLGAVLGTDGEICSSVCSIDVGNNELWIVCPRRLLCFESVAQPDPHEQIKKKILDISKVERPYAVWKEVKLKVSGSGNLKFDYTFDYIISSVDSRLTPNGNPVIVEIMTSSTSGGNKTKRTTTPQSFEDLLLGRAHQAPGINYRQVWGRMISQFFVKSQVAKSWGGMAFWVIQDSLADYIEKTTAFKMSAADAVSTSRDINLLSVKFGRDSNNNPSLSPSSLSLASGTLDMDALTKGFLGILGTPFTPDISTLNNLLLSKPPIQIVR
jgi:hypothetical protein